MEANSKNNTESIYRFLHQYSEFLAILYIDVKRIIDDSDYNWNSKVRFVCHGFRDICNRLPELISGQKFNSFKTDDEIKKLHEKWLKNSGVESVGDEKELQPNITPRLYDEIDTFFKQHKQSFKTKEEKARLMFGSISDHIEDGNEIYPILRNWVRIVGFFQRHAHQGSESTKLGPDELSRYVGYFEQTLLSFSSHYFSIIKKVKHLVEQINNGLTPPSDEILNNAINLLAKPEYIRYFYENLKNPFWLILLKEKGCFDRPPEPPGPIKNEDGIEYRFWPQSKYLVNIAPEKPRDVLDIIKSFDDTNNVLIIRDCFQALAKMPVEIAAEGIGFAKKILSKGEYLDWDTFADKVAEWMVHLGEGENKKIDEAFLIASLLLEVKIKESEYYQSWHSLESRFSDYWYEDFVFKYYKKLWEIDGLRAGKILVDLIDRQIGIDQAIRRKEELPETIKESFEELFGESNDEEDEFDFTEHSYINMPDIATVENEHPDIADLIIGGIRMIGEYLMQTNTDQAKEYIEYLRSKRRAIYKRIEIHLQRYAPEGDEWNRWINDIIGNIEENTRPNFRQEYKALLHDKYEILEQSVKEKFLKWVEEQGEIRDQDEFNKWFRDNKKRNPTETDYEEYRNRYRVQALHCIKDKEPELYQKYFLASNKKEEDIVARPSPDGYAPAAPKYSPINSDEIKKKSALEVIRYVIDYDRSHSDEEETVNVWERVDRKEALASVFIRDVKERLCEYLEVDNEIMVELSRRFIRNYLYAAREIIQNDREINPDWQKIIELCRLIYEKWNNASEYNSVMQSLIHIIEIALKGRRDEKGELSYCNIEEEELGVVWHILDEFVDYTYEDDWESEGVVGEGLDTRRRKTDPFQICANRVCGTAFETVIRFGLYCKNKKIELYASTYSEKLIGKFKHVLEDVKKPEVICVFGVFFPNICWLEEEWMKENLDEIFNDDNWYDTWGSYIKWSHPTQKSFEIAIEKYKYALDKSSDADPYADDDEGIDERFVGHIMRAYWQGWESTEINHDSLMNAFLEKASDELKERAAIFLSEGFEYLKDHKEDDWKKEVRKRLYDYWRTRLDAIKGNPDEHQNEALAFTRWVKDAPFDNDVTLKLLEETMGVTNNRISGYGRVSDFLEGLCEISEGNELTVLTMIRDAMKYQETKLDFSIYNDKIKSLMDRVLELNDNYPDISDIRKKAREVANTYGSMGVDTYSSHDDILRKKDEGD